ncbi:hypothetical protein C9890_0354 [Perkinsus sp. BL_2016]|nr:hypothetical protein C9890_0354 [Perkinsus sp. BL_2016]
MLYWCRRGADVLKVLDRANRILSTPIYDSGPKSTISNFVRRNVPGVRFDGEISFAQLVSMIDIAVEDRMAHTAPRSPQIKPPQSLSTMDSRKEIDEVETVDFSPHMTLSELVDVHEPFKPVVNNVVRDLGPKFTTMEYSTMVDSVLKIKSMCLKGELFQIQLTNGVDLHGTKRGIPQEHFVSPDFLKHELFLTPLLSCLFENYSRLDSIMSGYLWALSQIRNFMIEARNGDEGEQQSVDTDCEEILSVYAIVYANSADAIMNGEPIGWCRSLRGLTNAEGARLLSSLEILKAIAVIGNKTVGMTRFGPSNASVYTRTFSQYLAEALHVVDADEVGALEINQDDGTGTVTVAEMISSFGREERLSEGVWTPVELSKPEVQGNGEDHVP